MNAKGNPLIKNLNLEVRNRFGPSGETPSIGPPRELSQRCAKIAKTFSGKFYRTIPNDAKQRPRPFLRVEWFIFGTFFGASGAPAIDSKPTPNQRFCQAKAM